MDKKKAARLRRAAFCRRWSLDTTHSRRGAEFCRISHSISASASPSPSAMRENAPGVPGEPGWKDETKLRALFEEMS